jgi:hypothetical protein
MMREVKIIVNSSGAQDQCYIKLLFLHQFLMDWPEIKTGCFPICILCACYIKWYLMSLFQFDVFGLLKGFLKVQQL